MTNIWIFLKTWTPPFCFTQLFWSLPSPQSLCMTSCTNIAFSKSECVFTKRMRFQKVNPFWDWIHIYRSSVWNFKSIVWNFKSSVYMAELYRFLTFVWQIHIRRLQIPIHSRWEFIRSDSESTFPFDKYIHSDYEFYSRFTNKHSRFEFIFAFCNSAFEFAIYSFE